MGIRRAFADDPLAEFVPQEDKSLMGVRQYRGHSMLVRKFAFRKNIRGGCVLFRPCLCDEKHDQARTLCPAPSICPVLRGRTEAGKPLFHMFPPSSANRTLKQVMAKIENRDGSRFTSHGFLRGETQEIKDIGRRYP